MPTPLLFVSLVVHDKWEGKICSGMYFLAIFMDSTCIVAHAAPNTCIPFAHV